MNKELGLHQELVLLSLNDSTGNFESTMLTYGLAGAVLSELMLRDRIAISSDDEKLVSVKLSRSTDDPILDEVLKNIEGAAKPASLNKWVTKTANIKDLAHRLASQLAEYGILKKDEKKVLWLFSKRVYPELDSTYEDSIRKRMAALMFDDKAPVDEHIAVLVTFAKCTNTLAPNFARVELQQHAKRIESICNGDVLAGSATQETIAAVQAAQMAAMIASTAAITAATVATN